MVGHLPIKQAFHRLLTRPFGATMVSTQAIQVRILVPPLELMASSLGPSKRL